jgi:hypothetical protein
VVKEKQRQRQENSSYIARAVIENNEKFKIINELYQKQKQLLLQKDELMTKILNIYHLGFKNFSRRKIVLGTIKGRSYYASPKGIVRPLSQRQIRAHQTEDFIKSFHSRVISNNIQQEIIDIGQNKKNLRKNMNFAQRKIFNKFFKNYQLAKEEPRVVLKFKKPIQIIELTAGFSRPYIMKAVDSVSLLNNGINRNAEFDFNFSLNGAVVITIRFSRLYLANGINEKIFIEQTFSYLKVLLQKEIINRQKEIKRLNIFYSKVKKDFGDYIILEKIEKE